MMMKAKVMMGSLLLAGALGGTAVAGQKWPTFNDGNVVINPSSRTAYGIVSSARNSPNASERLSCSVSASTGGSKTGVCSFTDGKGYSAYCYSSDANIINAIGFTQSDSYVWAAWDASGQCTSISVYTDSAYVPKAP